MIKNKINGPNPITPPTQYFHKILPFDDVIFQDDFKQAYHISIFQEYATHPINVSGQTFLDN